MANIANSRSGRHKGWHDDGVNGRLVAEYNGTEVFDFDANDLAIAPATTMASTLVVTGAVTASTGLTVTAGGLTVTAGDLALTAGNFLIGTCGDLQLLCAAGTDIFLAVSCSEPSAAKGTVWVYAGAACAVAPAGSGFLMIVDDGCV